MTPYEIEYSGLVAQWVGAVAPGLAVLVAIVFGAITLATSRRSKDTQERATLTAAEPLTADFAQAVLAVSRVNWEVRHHSGDTWLLTNTGNNTAHNVMLAGMTEVDRKRLTPLPDPETVGPTGSLAFTLMSRFTLSGPANVIVSFSLESDQERLQQIVRVPAL